MAQVNAQLYVLHRQLAVDMEGLGVRTLAIGDIHLQTKGAG